MTTILIYRLEDKKLDLRGKWVDGEFVYDEGGFSDIDYIEEYTEDMIMERFSGMYYYAITRETLHLINLKERLISTW